MEKTNLKIPLIVLSVVILMVGLLLLIRPYYEKSMESLCKSYQSELNRVEYFRDVETKGRPLTVWKVKIKNVDYIIPAFRYTKMDVDSKSFSQKSTITINASNRFIVVEEHSDVEQGAYKVIKRVYQYKKEDIKCWPSRNIPISDMFLRYTIVQNPGALYIDTKNPDSFMLRSDYDNFSISTVYNPQHHDELLSYGNIGKDKAIFEVPIKIFYGNYTLEKTPGYIQDAIDYLERKKTFDPLSFEKTYGLKLEFKTTQSDTSSAQ